MDVVHFLSLSILQHFVFKFKVLRVADRYELIAIRNQQFSLAQQFANSLETLLRARLIKYALHFQTLQLFPGILYVSWSFLRFDREI